MATIYDFSRRAAKSDDGPLTAEKERRFLSAFRSQSRSWQDAMLLNLLRTTALASRLLSQRADA